MRAIAICSLMVLVACGQSKEILEGDRLSLDGSPVFLADSVVTPTAVSMPKVTTNSSWTNPEGNALKNLGNVKLSASPTPLWSVDAFSGSSRRAIATASPVVADGRIFVLGANSDVSAISRSGVTLWNVSLSPSGDNISGVSGGSLTVFDGQVFVSTGFGELVALNSATGTENWRQDTESSGLSPAIQSGNILYLTARNGTAFALKPENGKILWQIGGPGSAVNTAISASPTITSKWSLFPFATGEVMSTFKRGGIRNWSAVITGRRDGAAVSTIGDIVSGPILTANSAIVGNNQGQIVSLNMSNGERNWTTMEGVRSYIAKAGRDVFFVNDKNEFIRLNSANGMVIYRKPLPYYTTDRVKKRDEIVAHFGPVLAGGRLVIASSDGLVRFIDPNTGSVVSHIELSEGASAAPAIANATLYITTKDGKLSAFR